MSSKEHKLIRGLPNWGLSLLTAFVSLIVCFFLASLLGSIQDVSDNLGEGIAYFIYNIIITIACFFICRKDPKSIWYVPILCNIGGIISALVEPNFWITPLWIFIGSGWILSLSGAVFGAVVGNRSLKTDL